MISSTMPSAKYSCSGSPLMLRGIDRLAPVTEEMTPLCNIDGVTGRQPTVVVVVGRPSG